MRSKVVVESEKQCRNLAKMAKMVQNCLNTEMGPANGSKLAKWCKTYCAATGNACIVVMMLASAISDESQEGGH